MAGRKKISVIDFCLWLMAALYIILPTYFAFEVSSFLPSFTGSRIVLLLTLIILMLVRKKVKIPKVKEMKMIWSTSIMLVLVNILHLSDSGSYAIKAIFSILLENVILVLVLYNLVDTKDKLNRFIKIMVVTSSVITCLATVEFLTGYNVFYLLTTTSRTVYQASYIRSGMTRAEASFSHSVYYGVYCSCMLPFSLYLYENTKNKKYLLCGLLNVLGTLMSGSRGQMVTCFVTTFLMLCKKRADLKRKYFRAIVLTLIPAAILIVFVPGVFAYINENVKSILNIIGFNFNISSDFGINIGGLDSRTIQLTGIRWLIINGAFWLGLGSLASARGLVSYYWASYGWQTVKSIDVGYVGWFLEYGLIGAIAYFALFLSVTWIAFRKSNDKNIVNIINPFKWFMICYLLNLLSSTGMDKLLWVALGLLVVAEYVTQGELVSVGESK